MERRTPVRQTTDFFSIFVSLRRMLISIDSPTDKSENAENENKKINYFAQDKHGA
jgi:hypothetical protein